MCSESVSALEISSTFRNYSGTSFAGSSCLLVKLNVSFYSDLTLFSRKPLMEKIKLFIDLIVVAAGMLIQVQLCSLMIHASRGSLAGSSR